MEQNRTQNETKTNTIFDMEKVTLRDRLGAVLGRFGEPPGGHFSCLNYAYNVRVCVRVCIQSSKNCFLALPKGKKERKNNLNAVRF